MKGPSSKIDFLVTRAGIAGSRPAQWRHFDGSRDSSHRLRAKREDETVRDFSTLLQMTKEQSAGVDRILLMFGAERSWFAEFREGWGEISLPECHAS